MRVRISEQLAVDNITVPELIACLTKEEFMKYRGFVLQLKTLRQSCLFQNDISHMPGCQGEER